MNTKRMSMDTKRIGHSENKSMVQFLPFEDEVGPRVANTTQQLSLTEVAFLVLSKPGGQIWSRYPIMRDLPAANRGNCRQSSATPRFRMMKIASYFYFQNALIANDTQRIPVHAT